MKKINITLYSILLVLVSHVLSAQNIANLEGINYQAVAIDAEGKEIVGMDIEGKPLYKKTIGIRFTILSGSDGPVYYQETHSTNTDQNGLFSLVIGQGEMTGEGQHDNLMDIPWINGDQFLKVELSQNNDGNYRVVSNEKFMAVPYSFYTDDIADDAVTSNKILNETIQNEDIGDSTIDLSSKVRDTLPVENGGTGTGSLTDGGLLIGGGLEPIKALPQAQDGQIPVGISSSDPVLKALAGGSGIQVTQKSDSVIISSTITGGVEADGTQSLDIGVIAAGDTYISPSFPVPGDGSGEMGDIVLASIDKNLRGCMLTPYFFSANTIKVAIFNGTGSNVNLGNGVNVKLLIVQ